MITHHLAFLEVLNDFDGFYEFEPMRVFSTVPEAIGKAVEDLDAFRKTDAGKDFNDYEECLNIEVGVFREKLISGGFVVVTDSSWNKRRVYRVFCASIDVNLNVNGVV